MKLHMSTVDESSMSPWLIRRVRLERENQNIRDALQRIVDMGHTPCHQLDSGTHCAACVALEALDTYVSPS